MTCFSVPSILSYGYLYRSNRFQYSSHTRYKVLKNAIQFLKLSIRQKEDRQDVVT